MVRHRTRDREFDRIPNDPEPQPLHVPACLPPPARHDRRDPGADPSEDDDPASPDHHPGLIVIDLT